MSVTALATNVFPRLPRSYRFYKGFGHTVLAGSFCGRFLAKKDIFDARFCQDSVVVGFSDKSFVSATSLICAIAHVLCLSSDKKMFWIYATRIIALMQNAFSFWYFASIYRVRKSMRKMFRFSSVLQDAIPFVIKNTRPLPTLFGFFNVLPKMTGKAAIQAPATGAIEFYSASNAQHSVTQPYMPAKVNRGSLCP